MREIRILPAVLMDLADSAAWYDQEGYAGLGDRFIDSFYASLPKIRENGDIYRAVYLDFRKVIIQPFPYSVYFRLFEEKWVVTLVAHAARRPGLIQTVLRNRA